MKGFRFVGKLSIKGKLMLIVMSTSIIALLLAGAAFIVYERHRVKQQMVQDISALGMLIADRSTAALAFNDTGLARENLASLRIKPSVVGACIYAADGSVFAEYNRSKGGAIRFPEAAQERSSNFESGRLNLFEPILLEGKRVGTVFISVSLKEVDILWQSFFLSASLIIFFAGLVAVFLSSRLQRIVSEPLAHLTKTAQIIASKKDYSVRAARESDDEVGVLVSAFNEMLDTIDGQNRELVQTNKNLQESELKYRELVQNANSIILRWNREGKITFLNEFGQNFFGYSEDEIIGRHVVGTLVPETESSGRDLSPLMDEICAHPEKFEHSINENIRRSGERLWIAWTNKTVVNDKGQVVEVLSIGSDITQRKQAEKELEKYRLHLEELVKERTAELEEANIKLRELDTLKSMFIASMSHELRTPLNSIIGFTGMTLQGLSGELNDEQKDNLARVYQSARHLLSLITDVIDISKIEAGRIDSFPEEIFLQKVIDEAIVTVEPQLKEKRLTLKVDMPEDVKLNTDRKRLLQCLINFLSNGVKFTEKGGVSIAVRERDADVEISVTDTGIGIPEKEMPKLFEAFERLDTHLRVKAGGTGLGLYLTKKLAADILRGSISVQSTEGVGSTFTLRVPKVLQPITNNNIIGDMR